MAWTNIAAPLLDKGLDGARCYLVDKVGIVQENATFSTDRTLNGLTGGAHSPPAYHLHILSHGLSDMAGMDSGEYTDGGKVTWDAATLASRLVGLGLPYYSEGRIKLCLCHSAEHIGHPTAPPIMQGVFAQNLARALYKKGKVHGLPGAPPLFENVYVGGFTVPVNWKYGRVNQRDGSQNASRVYYRCDAAGTLVTNAANASGLRDIPKHERQQVRGPGEYMNKVPPVGGNKWTVAPKPAVIAPVKVAYFPFAYTAK